MVPKLQNVLVMAIFVIFGLPAWAHFESLVDVPGMMIDADFVFKGTVIKVQYKNSQLTPVFELNGNPVLDEDGNQAYADGSDIPHAFVAYQIELVYKPLVF